MAGIESLEAEGRRLGDALLALLQEAEQEYDSGSLTWKALRTLATRVHRVSVRPYRKIYKAYRQAKEKATTASHRRTQEAKAQVLAAPAPPCPYCAKSFPTMSQFLDHLKERHGWLKGEDHWRHRKSCACGVGKSWSSRADLARHLLRVGDLEEHLALAVLKTASVPPESGE